MQQNQHLALGLSLGMAGLIILAICIFYYLHHHKQRVLAEHTASTLEAQAARANGTPTGDGPLLHLSNSVLEQIAPLPVSFQGTSRFVSSIPRPVKSRSSSPQTITGIKRVSSIPVPISPVTPMPGSKRVSWAALPRPDRTIQDAHRSLHSRKPTPMSFCNNPASYDADINSSSETSATNSESPGSLIVTLTRTPSPSTASTCSSGGSVRFPRPTRPVRHGRLTPETTIRVVAVGAKSESPEREAARYGGRVIGGRDASSNWVVYDYSPRKSVSTSNRNSRRLV